ncbi:fructosamine kinase family protein [Saccharobesus litoralis]|uniref:Fructosamine kinase family protein n=1 Tax=Saccharobesus litoralis TaxID=2172099 RepID=A0A2S0VT34_9ALTE|nr:fructosamine kinase family protein [Saccharobesus litoralis]AWB67342.1 fructosamine kinase family protein [Saccharobesus litoralis]
MWNAIENSIASALGSGVKILSKTPLTGGDIHQAYKIETSDKTLFVKINDADKIELFLTEANSLQRISKSQTIKVPEFIACDHSKNCAFLLLEYLPLQDDLDGGWQHMGERLAGLHLYPSQEMFGWDEDNYIGLTSQPNAWHKKWHHFFAEQRIGFQLELLQEKGIQWLDINEFVDITKRLLATRTPMASLIHGDLWRGNHAFSNGVPVIFDPACYYADYEAELAMTELFGCLPPEFYQAYYAITPKENGYTERKQLYNLYHILNHCNLFGDSYLAQAKHLTQQIIAY